MHRNLSFWLGILGLLLAVVFVASLWEPRPAPAPAPTIVPSSPPAMSLLPNTIGARGMVESADENIRVASPLPGIVAAVPVKVGERVQAGDLLLQIDDRDTRALLEALQSMLAVQEAKLKVAEVALADRSDQIQRVELLRRERVTSEDEVQRARFAVQSAQAALQQAQADVSSAKAQIARAKVQLEMLSVRAPRGGAVLQIHTRPGEYATPQASGEPLLILGSIEKLRVRCEVEEGLASRIKPDCGAIAFFKGQRANPIPLRSGRIEPFIVTRKFSAGEIGERAERRVLHVLFEFAKPEDVRAYAGQQLDVFIDDKD